MGVERSVAGVCSLPDPGGRRPELLSQLSQLLPCVAQILQRISLPADRTFDFLDSTGPMVLLRVQRGYAVV